MKPKTDDRPERVRLPPSPHSDSWPLYAFMHRGKQYAVWLHKISVHSEFIRGPGYVWGCSCGANNASLGRPLSTQILHEAWSHFDGHLDPKAEPLRINPMRWFRGGSEPDLNSVFELEVARILGLAPELPVEVVHRCGTCGETFQISKTDPHWCTGRGPICPQESPIPS